MRKNFAIMPLSRKEAHARNSGQPMCGRTATIPGPIVECARETVVLRSLFPLAVGFNCQAPGEIHEPPINPGEVLLLYGMQGTGWCEVCSRRHPLSPGDLLVYPPGVPRVYGDRGRGWTFSWVHAAGTNLDFFLSQLGASLERPVLDVGEDSRWSEWFRELHDIAAPNCGTAELLYASQTLAHLLSALICRHRQSPDAGTDTARRIDQSVAYMKQHLDEPLRASTLAAVAHMSLPHYFAVFKQRMGATPIDYFIKLRMEHARRLLAETCWSVKEVATALGYEDPLYFSRVFKSVSHSTPSEYRSGYKGENGVLDRARKNGAC